MMLRKQPLPADPPTGPIRCRECLRKLRSFGFTIPGKQPSWRCRRCAVARAVRHGMPQRAAEKRAK